MFYGPFCAYGRLNGPSDFQRQWSEVVDETLFRYAHAEIRTQVVVICGPTRYQLDHGGGAPIIHDGEMSQVILIKYILKVT